jgi:hypothetical protein
MAQETARDKEEQTPAETSGLASVPDRTFGLTAAGTSVPTELRAGLATFLTMAYIMFVNPAILGKAGMDHGAVFVATCLAAALSTAIMGLYANYPIALAPGMGLNAYFAFTMVPELGGNWQLALGVVFLSGALFLLISLTRLREWLINAIPMTLKLGIAAGIGLFLALIRLAECRPCGGGRDHAGQARRPHPAEGAARHRRLPRHCRARGAEGAGRHHLRRHRRDPRRGVARA